MGNHIGLRSAISDLVAWRHVFWGSVLVASSHAGVC